ncbi:MAG: hypothetical protein NUV46_04055 [Nanoarchaeota archaeon]|nr:hypothetical protein [Nanoarchaeota archaeon]
MRTQELNKLAFGYSLAIVSAVAMLLFGLFGYAGTYGGMVNMMSEWHMYFAISPLGIIMGMIEAAIWGFVFGYAIALIYNKIVK